MNWADTIAASQALRSLAIKTAPEARIELGEDFTDDFARVRVEARALYGPGRLGLLKWIDARGQMMRPALHPLDPLWLSAFGDYYASRKLIMLARKGLRAGGSSSACPALVRCAAFGARHLDAGTIGVIPIMSAARDEADGRFVTIRSYLRAIGLLPKKKGTKGDDAIGSDDPDEDGISYDVPPGGISGTFQSKRSASGGGIIAIADSYGHRIQFRILPALVKHGVGYTGVAGFADESDLWPNDPEHHVNPAEKIFDRISERFTTTTDDESEDPGAEFLIFSASYNPDSAHKRAIDDVIATDRGDDFGDRVPVLTSEIAHLVRLGREGARRDEESRRGLARAMGSTDPRLLAPGDPMSPDLPAWAFNPSEKIEKCLRFSKGNVSRMLAMYGGRAAENAGEGAGLDTLRGVEFPVDERPIARASLADVVIGVAPSVDGSEWGIVAVGFASSGALVILADRSALADSWSAVNEIAAIVEAVRPSVIVAHRQHADRVRADVAAWAGASRVMPAPVADAAVYDGDVLRVSALRSLYATGRIRHATGLATLEGIARTWTPASARVPRLEALAAAVKRLVDCYPSGGVAWENGRTPTPRRGMNEGQRDEP